jgi:hypothetical protein
MASGIFLRIASVVVGCWFSKADHFPSAARYAAAKFKIIDWMFR